MFFLTYKDTKERISFTMYCSLFYDFPVELMVFHVLPKLELQDLVRLSSAVAHKPGRLHEILRNVQHVLVEDDLLQYLSAVDWIVKNGIQLSTAVVHIGRFQSNVNFVAKFHHTVQDFHVNLSEGMTLEGLPISLIERITSAEIRFCPAAMWSIRKVCCSFLLKLRLTGFELSTEETETLLQSCPLLTNLTFCLPNTMYDAHLVTMTKHCPQLRSVSLHPTAFSADGFRLLTSSCRCIESIQVFGICQVALLVQTCVERGVSLQSLSLCSVPAGPTRRYQRLLQQLNKITLSGAFWHQKDCAMHLLSYCTHLTEISLNWPEGSGFSCNDAIRVLTTLRALVDTRSAGLTSLTLEGVPSLSSDLIKALCGLLAHCTKLEFVQIMCSSSGSKESEAEFPL